MKRRADALRFLYWCFWLGLLILELGEKKKLPRIDRGSFCFRNSYFENTPEN